MVSNCSFNVFLLDMIDFWLDFYLFIIIFGKDVSFFYWLFLLLGVSTVTMGPLPEIDPDITNENRVMD